MADYGIKATLSGYDVDTAPDYLQSFNSSFPLLKTLSTSTSSGTVSHNLGYYPFHLIVSTSEPGGIDQFAHTEWSVSTSQLVRQSGSGSRRYFIFRQNLEENFTAPTLDGSGVQTEVNNDYGIKISLPGKSVNSNDMRDYALNTGSRSPAIHMVRHTTMSSGSGDYWYELDYNLSYSPLVFVFIKPRANGIGLPQDRYGIVMPPVGVSGRWFMVDQGNLGRGGQGKVLVFADGSFFSQAPDVSVVVLKDPFIKEKIVVNR